MKYSFIIPYYNRTNQFKITLETFKTFYSERNDFEIIVVEDYKNYNNKLLHQELLNLFSEYSFIKFNHIIYDKDYCFNPAEMFNIGVDNSNGEYIILTNPEIAHTCNILFRLDNLLNINPNKYFVCSCLSVDNVCYNDNKLQYTPIQWYIHSIYHRRYLHFCSCISKSSFKKIKGFDTEYVNGIAYEDNDFEQRVRHNNIDIEIVDDLLTIHIEHSRLYDISPEEYNRLTNINKLLYQQKWNK